MQSFSIDGSKSQLKVANSTNGLTNFFSSVTNSPGAAAPGISWSICSLRTGRESYSQ